MQPPPTFKARADAALADPTLKIAIDRTTGTAERKRAAALADFPSSLRRASAASAIKDHVIAHLDHYLVEFERNAIASGAKVHWAAHGRARPARIVVELCREAEAKRVTRVQVDARRGDRAAACAGRSRHRAGRNRPRRAHHPARPATRLRTSSGRRCTARASRCPCCSRSCIAPRTPKRRSQAMVDSARRELRDKFLGADVGDLGRELPGRRHRRHLHRHQRRQRRAVHDAAARCTSSPPGSRSWCRRWRMRSRCCGCWCARPPAPS